MSQQGERYSSHEDDWWRQLYDDSTADDTGPVRADDTIDERFASARTTLTDPPLVPQRTSEEFRAPDGSRTSDPHPAPAEEPPGTPAGRHAPNEPRTPEDRPAPQEPPIRREPSAPEEGPAPEPPAPGGPRAFREPPAFDERDAAGQSGGYDEFGRPAETGVREGAVPADGDVSQWASPADGDVSAWPEPGDRRVPEQSAPRDPRAAEDRPASDDPRAPHDPRTPDGAPPPGAAPPDATTAPPVAPPSPSDPDLSVPDPADTLWEPTPRPWQPPAASPAPPAAPVYRGPSDAPAKPSASGAWQQPHPGRHAPRNPSGGRPPDTEPSAPGATAGARAGTEPETGPATEPGTDPGADWFGAAPAAPDPAPAAPLPAGPFAVSYVGDRPPTYDAEPTALPAADPDRLGGLVPDTVLDGAHYGSCTVRAVSLRGDSARFRGEPRRDCLLTARFGAGEQALVLVAMATGARATGYAHQAAAAACEEIGRLVGRHHAGLAEDIRAGLRGPLKAGLHRLTDRCLGRLRTRAGEIGVASGEYTATLRCLLLPADPDCRLRIFFGAGPGGLFRIRGGAWQDIEPAPPRQPQDPRLAADAEPAAGAAGEPLTMKLGLPAPPSPWDAAPAAVQGAPAAPAATSDDSDPHAAEPFPPFRFHAASAARGDVLLLCSQGLAEPLRGEQALSAHLTARWTQPAPPGLAAFLADAQVRVKGYADDRTAAAIWET